jgi:2-amino-4-hydroxy-6-hydroxymethyldihydropteridine diphosphokinase
MTYDVSLSLGSNINPRRNVKDAVKRINESFPIRAISSVYKTEPVGMAPGTEPFHNLCTIIKTDLMPGELKDRLRAMEREIGRRRDDNKDGPHYDPRRIDIDILTYNPAPDDFQPSDELIDQAYVVFPLSELMSPPEYLDVDGVSDWRDRCDGTTILERVDYNWPESLDRNTTGH